MLRWLSSWAASCGGDSGKSPPRQRSNTNQNPRLSSQQKRTPLSKDTLPQCLSADHEKAAPQQRHDSDEPLHRSNRSSSSALRNPSHKQEEAFLPSGEGDNHASASDPSAMARITDNDEDPRLAQISVIVSPEEGIRHLQCLLLSQYQRCYSGEQQQGVTDTSTYAVATHVSSNTTPSPRAAQQEPIPLPPLIVGQYASSPSFPRSSCSCPYCASSSTTMPFAKMNYLQAITFDLKRVCPEYDHIVHLPYHSSQGALLSLWANLESMREEYVRDAGDIVRNHLVWVKNWTTPVHLFNVGNGHAAASIAPLAYEQRTLTPMQRELNRRATAFATHCATNEIRCFSEKNCRINADREEAMRTGYLSKEVNWWPFTIRFLRHLETPNGIVTMHPLPGGGTLEQALHRVRRKFFLHDLYHVFLNRRISDEPTSCSLNHTATSILLKSLLRAEAAPLPAPRSFQRVRQDEWAMTKGGLPFAAVCAIAYELLAAIGALHADGLSHNDIHPGSISLDSRGHVVLHDFGLCAPLGEEPFARPHVPQDVKPAHIDIYCFGVTMAKLALGCTWPAILRDIVAEPVNVASGLRITPCADDDEVQSSTTRHGDDTEDRHVWQDIASAYARQDIATLDALVTELFSPLLDDAEQQTLLPLVDWPPITKTRHVTRNSTQQSRSGRIAEPSELGQKQDDVDVQALAKIAVDFKRMAMLCSAVRGSTLLSDDATTLTVKDIQSHAFFANPNTLILGGVPRAVVEPLASRETFATELVFPDLVNGRRLVMVQSLNPEALTHHRNCVVADAHVTQRTAKAAASQHSQQSRRLLRQEAPITTIADPATKEIPTTERDSPFNSDEAANRCLEATKLRLYRAFSVNFTAEGVTQFAKEIESTKEEMLREAASGLEGSSARVAALQQRIANASATKDADVVVEADSCRSVKGQRIERDGGGGANNNTSSRSSSNSSISAPSTARQTKPRGETRRSQDQGEEPPMPTQADANTQLVWATTIREEPSHSLEHCVRGMPLFTCCRIAQQERGPTLASTCEFFFPFPYHKQHMTEGEESEEDAHLVSLAQEETWAAMKGFAWRLDWEVEALLRSRNAIRRR